jgi:hypothetical protein
MNANELRIGNWVDIDNQHEQIEEISPYLFGCQYRWGWLEYTKPIKITHELLVKFRFEVFDFDNRKPNQYRFKEMLIVVRLGVFVDFGSDVKLEFVHDLQNLYFAKYKTELIYTP